MYIQLTGATVAVEETCSRPAIGYKNIGVWKIIIINIIVSRNSSKEKKLRHFIYIYIYNKLYITYVFSLLRCREDPPTNGNWTLARHFPFAAGVSVLRHSP